MPKLRSLIGFSVGIALVLLAAIAWSGWRTGAGTSPEVRSTTTSSTTTSSTTTSSTTTPFRLWVPSILRPAGSASTTPTPGAILTKINLTKGPELIYMGSPTGMKIFWQWTSSATFRVEWGPDSSYASGSASVTAYDAANFLYSYTITGLTPGQKYLYRVVTGSQYADGSFLTAPRDSAATLKFFSYGDTRTNPTQHDTVAAQVVAQAQADPAYQTFILNVGDLVSTGDIDSVWTSELYAPAFSHIRAEMANLPVLPVMGNHEGTGTLYKRYFTLPFVSGRYWSFDYGPVHVVMLDQFSAYGVGSAQYNWMKADLAATTRRWKIVVLHMPGWSANGGHSNDSTTQTDLEPVFEQYQVALVLAGHNHYYARAMVNGIAHLTVGTGGAPLYSPASGQPNIVSTYEGLGYARFEINGSSLTGRFIGSDGAVRDTFSLVR